MMNEESEKDPSRPEHPALNSYEADRLHMVNEQIRRRGVEDRHVLRAMETVPRHLFVNPEDRAYAYGDTPLPIGHGQTISQPYIVALMTELLEVGPGQRVLEIGTGSGYQAAVVSLLVDTVFSIECIKELGKAARERLAQLEYENIRVKVGDGYAGWIDEAPFDAIIVTAAPEKLPRVLIEQLADGGRMAIPVGTGYQELFRIVKTGDRIIEEKVADVRFVPMVESDRD